MQNMALLSIFLGITLLALISWFKRRRGSPWRGAPPSPPAVPLLGHLHLLMKPGTAPHTLLHSLSRRHGPIMSLKFGSVPIVVASTPGAAREFLKTHDATFSSRPAVSAGKLISYDAGIVFARHGDFWRHLRRLATTELLTARRLDSFRAARAEETRELCDTILESCERVVDLREKFKAHAFNIITYMLMHKRYYGNKVADREEATWFLHLMDQMFDVTGEFPIGDYFPWLRLVDPVQYRMKALNRAVDPWLEKNVSEHERNRPSEAKDMDFLDILLDLRDRGDEHLQRNTIKAFILNLLGAGTDTSSVTLEWALAEMISHPEIMSKAREEIESVVGRNRMVTESDVPTLHYLHAVVKETFRLHPAVPLLIPHCSTEASTVTGYHVPRNATLFVNVYAIGRDETVWERPGEFDPERFVRSAIDVRGQDFEVIPFGAGRRICPGINLGLVTIHLTLANLVHGFEWEASEVDTVSEHYGLNLLMEKKLEAVPRPRLSSHVYSSW